MQNAPLAYAVSIVIHLGALYVWNFGDNSLPVPLPMTEGRAVVELSASLARFQEAEPLREPLEHTPLAPAQLDTKKRLAENMAPAQARSLPSPAGELAIPVAQNDLDPKTTPERFESTAPSHEPSLPMRKFTRQIEHVVREIATDSSPASMASRAEEGSDVDELPRNYPNNPLPPYPREALSEFRQGLVLLHVRATAS